MKLYKYVSESRYEPVIEIPDNATNGDMIKAVFPNADITINEKWGINGTVFIRLDNPNRVIIFDLKWWNSPYRKEQRNDKRRTLGAVKTD